MDGLKDKVELIIKKVMSDKKFAKKFKETPTKAIEEVIGIDLPDEKIDAVIKMVTSKLAADAVTKVLNKKSGTKKTTKSKTSTKKTTSKSKKSSSTTTDILETVVKSLLK